jgi:Domain of unknown function (DUF1905)/Bacteriocin-protection, YdeI or OmpD-Associated
MVVDVTGFEGVIEGEVDGGTWVEIPADVVDQLGGGGRIPVIASFDGHPYRGSIAVYGGQHVLGVVKAVRSAIGKGVGDAVQVELALDEDERTVDVPVDMKSSLAAVGLAAQFDAMSYTKRRQAVDHIESSKASDTRMRRIEKLIRELGSTD